MGGEEVENILCTTSLPWRPLPPSLLHLFPTHPLIFFIPPSFRRHHSRQERERGEGREEGLIPQCSCQDSPPSPPSFLLLTALLGSCPWLLLLRVIRPLPTVVDYSWEEVDGDALQYSRYIRYTLLSRRE